MHAHIEPLGDSALVVRLGDAIDEPTRIRVHSAAAALGIAALPGVIDVVPAFTTVTLHVNLKEARLQSLVPHVEAALAGVNDVEAGKGRLIRIPVCYGGEWGPDLDPVASYVGASTEEVVLRHAAREYRVYMLGFLPGFAYLGGLDPGLSMPRHARPRARVLGGSVAIAGLQTGIYPIDSPGGWQVIGRTPCRMFDALRNPPAIVRPGDRVRFEAIDRDAYDSSEVFVS